MFYYIISSSLYVDKHLSENLIRCQMYHIFVFKNTNFSETADIVSILLPHININPSSDSHPVKYVKSCLDMAQLCAEDENKFLF